MNNKRQTILALTACFLVVSLSILCDIGLRSCAANDSNTTTEKSSVSSTAKIEATTQKEISWNLILVNGQNKIPDNYEVNLVEVEGGEQVDERIYKPLMEMLEAAKEANADTLPIIVSGYRTQENQEAEYNSKISEYIEDGYSEEEAVAEAQKWVALPGYSEHQLGLAVDINGEIYGVYTWLQENSYKYGFIRRYSGDKTEITGISNEEWHYRYVGVQAATEIYNSGLCLEEYLELSQ